MICPERYRRKRIEGEYEGNNAANLIGTAEHAMLEMVAKAHALGDEVDSDFAVEWALVNFERLVEKDTHSPDPIPWEKGSLEARRVDVEMFARQWIAFMPQVWDEYGLPKHVEYNFENVILPETQHTIGGTIDVLTERLIPLDWKHVRTPWRQEKAKRKVQRIFYSAAVYELFGEYPSLFVFLNAERVFLKTENRTRYKVRQYPVPSHPEEEMKFLVAMLDGWAAQIEANVFPLNISSGLCSPEWCPFWDTCPASAIDPTTKRKGVKDVEVN